MQLRKNGSTAIPFSGTGLQNEEDCSNRTFAKRASDCEFNSDKMLREIALFDPTKYPRKDVVEG